ncbi:hypothetical protein PUN28_007857 [Cardiocondyla obscurior]|uniref:Uncharacterized protein n=1 Tax=Cardiocondyla obscurior TaxID=286306 RepID=A0AAW2FY89_9HYME
MRARIMLLEFALGAASRWNRRAEKTVARVANCIVNFLIIEPKCRPDDSSIVVDDRASRSTMYKGAENYNDIRSHQKNDGDAKSGQNRNEYFSSLANNGSEVKKNKCHS